MSPRGKKGERHPKLCQCARCVERRWEAYEERLEDYRKAGITPRTPEQTVLVREYTVKPHFRRNGRHLSGDEALRQRVEAYLKSLLKRRS